MSTTLAVGRIFGAATRPDGGRVAQGDSVRLADVRREIDKDVYKVLVPLVKRGWTLRRQGHKFWLFCPCEGDEGNGIRVDGTPKNPTGQARRIAREAALCPDRHDLLR